MMKRKNIYGFAAALIAAGSLASCQNDLNAPSFGTENPNGVSLVKNPDIVSWSGEQTLASTFMSPTINPYTRGANTNANQWDNGWNCVNNVEDDLTEEDIDNIVKMFEIGEEVENTVIIPWKNYFVQQVYKGQSNYYTYDRCYQPDCDHVLAVNIKGSDHMDYLKAYNKHEEYGYFESNNWQGGYETRYYDHIANFNNGNNTNNPGACGNGKHHIGTTFMTDMNHEGVTASNQFEFHETYANNPHEYNNYIILKYKGYWFVGFDYEMHKVTDTHNHNESLDVPRDWKFTDWIVRIMPGFQAGETPDTPIGTPLLPDPFETGEPGSPDTNPDKPGNGNTNTPNVSNRHGNEVEVNYAILDSHDQYAFADLVTKLSIHVRKATDIEMKLPIPTKYLVESDDLYIFKEHYTGAYAGPNPFKDKKAQVNYDVYNNAKEKVGTVTLYVEFMDGESSLGEEYAEGYIRIWSEGISDEVIKACWETNKDGINFEIYNYFQTEEAIWNDDDEFATVDKYGDINRKDLFEAMCKARISFYHEAPDYFINAFGWNDAKNDKHPWHATVRPDISETYKKPTRGTHLNGTPYNDIYVHTSVEEADITHKH